MSQPSKRVNVDRAALATLLGIAKEAVEFKGSLQRFIGFDPDELRSALDEPASIPWGEYDLKNAIKEAERALALKTAGKT